jgi:hypothetical protein
MKPRLFKRSINMLGGNIFTEYSVWWVCKSNTHIAYGATPEEAYTVWKSMGEGRFNAAAYNNGWTEETIKLRLACFEVKNI